LEKKAIQREKSARGESGKVVSLEFARSLPTDQTNFDAGTEKQTFEEGKGLSREGKKGYQDYEQGRKDNPGLGLESQACGEINL